VPLPLSVTLLKVPLLVPDPRPKATVRPPELSWLPRPLLTVSVTVVVFPDWMLDEFTVTVDLAKFAVLGV